jgi:hypothetical protein
MCIELYQEVEYFTDKNGEIKQELSLKIKKKKKKKKKITYGQHKKCTLLRLSIYIV